MFPLTTRSLKWGPLFRPVVLGSKLFWELTCATCRNKWGNVGAIGNFWKHCVVVKKIRRSLQIEPQNHIQIMANMSTGHCHLHRLEVTPEVLLSVAKFLGPWFDLAGFSQGFLVTSCNIPIFGNDGSTNTFISIWLGEVPWSRFGMEEKKCISPAQVLQIFRYTDIHINMIHQAQVLEVSSMRGCPPIVGIVAGSIVVLFLVEIQEYDHERPIDLGFGWWKAKLLPVLFCFDLILTKRFWKIPWFLGVFWKSPLVWRPFFLSVKRTRGN